MKNILLSIIVPTRERLETLKYTLNALLKLNNNNIEILICDNASKDGTDNYLSTITDTRVRYLKSEIPLSMPQNFERGLLNSRGDYILTIGDDDLIIQNNLDFALKTATETQSDLVYWNRWYFYWSSFQNKNMSGTFAISTGKGIFEVNTNFLLILSYYGFLNYQYLPSIYNSIIKRSFLNKYKTNLRGSYFPDYVVSVDIFSSLIFSSMNPSTLYLESPVSVSCLSHRSSGMSIYTDQKDYKNFFKELGMDNLDLLVPKNLTGKIIILTLNGRNTLGLMVDYYNALEKNLIFTLNSYPSLNLFTRNFVSLLLYNKDIEFKDDSNDLKDIYTLSNNELIKEDPTTHFYKMFNIPIPNLYTGKFDNIEATSLHLFDHLQEINFNY